MPYPDPYYGQTPGTSYYGGNTAMAFGYDDALAAGSGLFSGLGSLTGNENEERTKSRNLQRIMSTLQLLEQMREFNRTQGLTEGQTAVGLQKDIEKLPMRDRLYYNLSARMGLPVDQLSYNTGSFSPVTSHSADPGKLWNQAQAGYTPGAGGVDLTGKVQNQLMGSLGYGNNPTQTSTLDQTLQHKPNQSTTNYAAEWLLNQMSGGNYSQYAGGGQPIDGSPKPGGKGKGKIPMANGVMG